MTDHSWTKGMTQLEAMLRDRDLPEVLVAVRSDTMRQHLNHLPDHVWDYAVAQSIEFDEWFPSVARLLDHAGTIPLSTRDAPRLAERAGVNETEQGRINREGLAQCAAVLLEHGIDIRSAVRPMPLVRKGAA